MISNQALPLMPAIGLLIVAAIFIGYFGTRLTKLADRLADQTGMGEAFMGAVGLGAVTSLPGITVSVVAARDGHAELAISNAVGGIAAQTAFLAIADIAYRKANLEHAAASVPNMMQAAILIVLLAMVLIASLSPNVSFAGIHPVTPLLFLAYLFGMRMVYRNKDRPMWYPQMTKSTEVDKAQEARRPLRGQGKLWYGFVLNGVIVIFAGWVVARAAESVVANTQLSQSLVGGVFSAITTSLPELITSIAAVRRGALTLAVGGIIGGNCFDTLFAAVADFAYADGSIYHACTSRELILMAATIIMTGVLLLGLLRRQQSGPGGIGFESLLILILYAGLVGLIAFT